MKRTNLNDVFSVVAAKYLTAVDTNYEVSHQHEVGGLSSLKRSWGEVHEGLKIPCNFIYLGDSEESHIQYDDSITWYDARQKVTHRGPEWRIYYPSNPVTLEMQEDDLLIVSKNPSGEAIFIVAKKDTSNVTQLLKLFRIEEIKATGFTNNSSIFEEEISLDFTSRFILDNLGIEYEYSDENYLNVILENFGETFPSTRVFSDFARSTFDFSEDIDDVDALLIFWMDHEELLFRTLEEHIVSKKLEEGFNDVDDFIKYSLSVHNRRKSRVGYAFENHLEEIFKQQGVEYSRGKVTEHRSKPDFLFPSIECYKNLSFNSDFLTILGVKSTCKDRWRQVLAEAKRIEEKHLITLEPAISESQLNEMKSSNLRLVVPKKIIPSYNESVHSWLINLSQFINLVKYKESHRS